MEKATNLDIEQLLKNEIEKTEALVLEYKEFTKPISPENAIGRISRMDAINNKAINDAALLKAETKLRNLKSALDRINEDDFGNCLKCKSKIPDQRIVLMPQSRYCVNCAR